MGLDQSAYSVVQGGRNDGEEEHLADWRKHNRLQGWMQQLWEDKGRPNAPESSSPMGDFNCIPLELNEEDIIRLEQDILDCNLPETHGFFFGSDSYSWTDESEEPFPEGDYWYKETDLQFVEDAKKCLEQGKKVFYSCWY